MNTFHSIAPLPQAAETRLSGPHTANRAHNTRLAVFLIPVVRDRKMLAARGAEPALVANRYQNIRVGAGSSSGFVQQPACAIGTRKVGGNASSDHQLTASHLRPLANGLPNAPHGCGRT